ncbi:MAG: glycerate kinase [Opitutales bacterium]|jgi:glycerate kinase
MRVLIAFDKFKESMTARQACLVAEEALQEALPDAEVEIAPICDGGEGFCEILTLARSGALETHEVHGPRMEPREALLGFVDCASLGADLLGFMGLPENGGQMAVVEMAQASGLWGLPAELRDPWECSTRGTGELLRIAARRGACAIVLGIGGSATNDLGLGALEALGLDFEDASGDLLESIRPALFERIASVRGAASALPPLLVACDVTNPLLGPSGASAVFGPQKGLRTADVPRMDAAVEGAARALCARFALGEETLAEPSGGAAGGLGWGLRAAFGARYLPGFELAWKWMDLESRLDRADLVIVGEGRFDHSSLGGKGPGTLARTALRRGKKVLVVAGSVEYGVADLLAADGTLAGCAAISPPELPLCQALAEGPARLRATLLTVLRDIV